MTPDEVRFYCETPGDAGHMGKRPVAIGMCRLDDARYLTVGS